MADDDTTVISIDDPPRRKTKSEILVDARIKALESRRRTQKVKLENKLQEIKILLGELDPDQIERAIQVIMDREAELRQKQAKVLGQLHDTIRSESKLRQAESVSIRRKLDALTDDLRALTQAVTKKREDNNRGKTPSVTTLSALSSLPEHPRKR